MISKTFILGILITYIPQLIDTLNGHTSVAVKVAMEYLPWYLDPLALYGIPAVASWISAVLLILARNHGVKTQTIASPITGLKKDAIAKTF